MQEIKKRRIVIASTLKPVDDTRMFEKMGMSLADTGRVEVFIIGFPSAAPSTYPNITFLPLKRFHRISLTRLLSPWKIMRKMISLSPDLIIINTHELLFPALLIRVSRRIKIIYDIRENYFRNILFTSTFSIWIRPLLAVWVRTKEILLSPAIDYFVLAEKGYEGELHFPGKKKITVENKLKRPSQEIQNKSKMDGLIHLLFSGTLADTTGVFNAIDLAKKLHDREPKIRLTIVGYCAQQSVLKRIKNEIREFRFIELKGGDQLVPHAEIMKEVQQADFGIIAYPLNLATQNTTPTKLYEYLGCKLPILLIDYQPWVERCSSYPACIPIPFDQPEIESILHQMKSTTFFTSSPDDVFWESEAIRFIQLVDSLLQK